MRAPIRYEAVYMKKQVKRMEEAIIPGYKLTEDDVRFLEEPYVLLPQRALTILPVTLVAQISANESQIYSVKGHPTARNLRDEVLPIACRVPPKSSFRCKPYL